MDDKNSVVGVYKSHSDAEQSVRELQKAGFAMKKLSIVGKDYHTEEHVVGYYSVGDRMKAWGKLGSFWGGLVGPSFWFRLFLCSWDRAGCCSRTTSELDNCSS